MILKFKIFYFFVFILVLFFLQEFSILLGNFVIPFYFVGCILFLLLYLLFQRKNFLSSINLFIKTKTGVFYSLFIIWVLIGIMFSIPKGTFIPISFFKNFIGNFFCSIFLPFLISMTFFAKYKNIKKINKLFLIIYFIIMLLGIIEYIGTLYDVSIIKGLFSILVNKISQISGKERVFVQAFGLPRISSVFQEPGEFASFIFISFPIIYMLSMSSQRILKNELVDLIIKKGLLFLTLVNMIGTQSPINLVFIGIFFSIALLKKFLSLNIKRKIITVVSFSLILSVSLTMFAGHNFSENYLIRIVNVAKNLTNVTEIFYVEQSLATRIGNYAAEFNVGKNNPICGVGYGNINSQWAKEILSLKMPITDELYIYATTTKSQSGGGSYLFKLIGETGFIGTILFYLFLLNMYLTSKKVGKKCKTKFMYNINNSFNLTLLLYILTSFYVTLLPIYCVYFGVVEAINLQYLKSKKMIK